MVVVAVVVVSVGTESMWRRSLPLSADMAERWIPFASDRGVRLAIFLRGADGCFRFKDTGAVAAIGRGLAADSCEDVLEESEEWEEERLRETLTCGRLFSVSMFDSSPLALELSWTATGADTDADADAGVATSIFLCSKSMVAGDGCG